MTPEQNRFWTGNAGCLQPGTQERVLILLPGSYGSTGFCVSGRGSDLIRFLISFSAQVLTIFLGFPLQ